MPLDVLTGRSQLEQKLGRRPYRDLIRDFPELRSELQTRTYVRKLLLAFMEAERPVNATYLSNKVWGSRHSNRTWLTRMVAAGWVAKMERPGASADRTTYQKPATWRLDALDKIKDLPNLPDGSLYYIARQPPDWVGIDIRPKPFELGRWAGVWKIAPKRMIALGVEATIAHSIGELMCVSMFWRDVPKQRARWVYFTRGHYRHRSSFGPSRARGNLAPEGAPSRADVLLALLLRQGASRAARQVWDAYPDEELSNDRAWLRRRLHEESLYAAADRVGIAKELDLRAPRRAAGNAPPQIHRRRRVAPPHPR